MARALLAGPMGSHAERQALRSLDELVRQLGHETAGPLGPPKDDAQLRRMIENADCVIAILDGLVADPATVWVCGYARAARRPVLGIRTGPHAAANNLPLAGGVTEALNVETPDDPTFRSRVESFLGSARVFAGTLVRDAVPKLLKDEGKEMRFRQVAESEYPPVLKRKLVETAQRLEDSDFGVEQEEIADMLELLETLINLRRYDRESLRSIKEGKWRKRGGFQKGFLLDEEPVLLSR